MRNAIIGGFIGSALTALISLAIYSSRPSQAAGPQTYLSVEDTREVTRVVMVATMVYEFKPTATDNELKTYWLEGSQADMSVRDWLTDLKKIQTAGNLGDPTGKINDVTLYQGGYAQVSMKEQLPNRRQVLYRTLYLVKEKNKWLIYRTSGLPDLNGF